MHMLNARAQQSGPTTCRQTRNAAASSTRPDRAGVPHASKLHGLGSALQQALPAVVAAVALCLEPLGATALANPNLTPDEQRTINIFRDATPSVVSVKNLAVRRDVFTPNMLEIPQGGGSGLIWDREGHVVTNYHVISDASDIQVSLDGGIDMKARVLGIDADRDIAVLQLLPGKPQVAPGAPAERAVPPGGEPPLKPVPDTPPTPNQKPQRNETKRDRRFRDADSKIVPTTSLLLDPPQVNLQELQPMKRCSTSSKLLVGQRVYAIGNPFGLDHTLTTGVVSGTGREIQSVSGRPIQDVIQTDAAINPGNSGGPLLDSGGCLIGINTAIYSPSGANSGVGFAIPVDTVNNSVQQIIQTGRVVRPILGIAFAPEQSSDQLGVKGILVLSAKDNGPAAKAGVKGTSRDEFGRLVLGDIIIGINGQPIKTSSDLYRILDKAKVGDTIKLEVLRGNEKETLAVTLETNEPQ